MHLWDEFLVKQEKEFGKETVDRWLRTLKLIRFDACNLSLEANDSFQRLWFEEHIRPKLKDFVNNNKTPIKIHITTAGTEIKAPKTQSQAKSPNKSPNPLKGKKYGDANSFTILFEGLDPSYLLSEFVPTNANLIVSKLFDELTIKGSELRLKMAIDNSSFSLPKDAVNPIYIYGPQGVGKTHLLQGCAHAFKKMGLQVIYARTELFTDHVVRAIRAAEMPKFREMYRKADILIVDDVHELAKKTATQEEFFHTFNTLHTAGKQIILSANVAPQELTFIEPRLVSRFEWGISLSLEQLQKKELLTMMERRSQFFHFPLHERTAEFLAETFPSSTTSIMRAFQALMLRTHLHLKQTKSVTPVTVAQARSLLTDLIEEENRRKVTPEKILHAVAECYGIRIEDIAGKSQSRDCVTPRQLSMHLCRELLKLPYMKIGDLFMRDHSTVMSGCRQIAKLLQEGSPELRSNLTSIEQRLCS